VLVQREMENWRFPLASIAPSSAGPVGRTSRDKWRLVNWAAAETATGFKKGKHVVGGPRSHSPGGGEQTNKLARKENDGPNAHTPHQATSVWPLSDMPFLTPNCGSQPGLAGGRYLLRDSYWVSDNPGVTA
jgi:hypothetical protein